VDTQDIVPIILLQSEHKKVDTYYIGANISIVKQHGASNEISNSPSATYRR